MTQTPPPPATPKTNGLAIASLVLSLICCIGSIPAVICGHLALKQIAQRGDGGSGLAKAGLIIGYITIALGVIFVILGVVGMGSLPWAEMQQQMNMP